eukprot:GHUV01057037.1.p1 GENE.GHUV01057037.1~~GHUV01057037.1.p1  ORF type:complete len:254 (+),score=58.81 GHUV01057037.1:615-1376(+)
MYPGCLWVMTAADLPAAVHGQVGQPTPCSCLSGSCHSCVRSTQLRLNWMGHYNCTSTQASMFNSLQVFQSFIDGFGVYGPLLSQIKRVFNRAIEDGLKDGLENSELRQQLLEVRREQAAAEAAGRAEVIDGQQPLREELYHAIAAMQARLSAAERRRNLAAKDLNRSKQELERIRGLAKAGKATKQRLVDSAAAEAEWLTKPGASGIIAMTAGPLTRLVSREGPSRVLLCILVNSSCQGTQLTHGMACNRWCK